MKKVRLHVFVLKMIWIFKNKKFTSQDINLKFSLKETIHVLLAYIYLHFKKPFIVQKTEDYLVLNVFMAQFYKNCIHK